MAQDLVTISNSVRPSGILPDLVVYGVGRNFPGMDKENPYLLEFKTASEYRFKNLQKLGS